MRKLYLLFLMLLLSLLKVNAQANFYSFSVESGTYSEISGGVLFSTSGGTQMQSNDGSPSFDSYASGSFTIPPFNYAGVTYTDIRITSNGQLVFGTGGSVPTSSYRAMSNSFANNVVLSPFGADLNVGASGLSDIRYQTINDETIIQWRNFRRYARSEEFSFQIRLNNVTGVIKFIYGGNPPYESSTLYQPQIGIKTDVASYNYVILGTGNSWSNATASTSGVSDSSICTFNGNIGFTNGLTYIFTPPPPCTGTPNGGTVSLATQTICSGITPAVISVTNVNPGVSAISYQWQESDDNGVADAWEDVTTGTGSTTLSFIPPAFTGVHKYYRLKTTCTSSNQVAYSDVSSVVNYSNPLTLASALTFTEITDFSMKVNWTNGNGTRRMVVINNVNDFIAPIDGSGPAIVTNTIYSGTGQQIIYDGSGSTVTVTGLNCSATYYVRVYEYNRCGTSAPYQFWYGMPLEGSQITNTTTLSTAVVNMNVDGNFTGFNSSGDNLSTILPGWAERRGDAAFSANTSLWRGGVSLQNIPTARVELYTNTRKEWIITPVINLNVASRITLKAAITAYNTVNAASGSNAPRMQGTDDKVQVMISTDACGNVWTPLFTFDASNTVNLTNILQDFEVPIPAQFVGQNVRIGFKATDGPTDDAPDYDFHIANIVIEPQPSCADVFGVTTANVLKNAVTVSWNSSTPAPSNGYEIEIRTSGEPGTPGATQVITTLAGVITSNIVNLTPSTTYQVYVRTVCDDNMKGSWSVISTFTTLCDYPDLISVSPDTICGIGTLDLTANFSNNQFVKWYSSITGGNLLHTGINYTTPEIDSTTSYFVQAGNPIPNSVIQVGNSTTTSSSAPNSPYAYGWGGYKFQYIYTAAELNSYGLEAGPINSVGFNISASATASRPGFTVYIGSTSQSVATTTHVGDLTLVYSNSDQPLQLGINSYSFTTPYIWDGISNIVVQVSWSNVDAASGTAASVFSHTTSASQTTYTYADRRLPSQILATMTGTPEPGPTGTSNGSTAISSARPNTYFNGVGICNSPRIEVVATVTSAPVLTLSHTDVEICKGESQLVTIEDGSTDYDSYEWVPSVGVTGNSIDGWMFSPSENTTYQLTATQTAGANCTNILELEVVVKSTPEPLVPLNDEYLVCINEVQELDSAVQEIEATFIEESFTGFTQFPSNWQTQVGTGDQISIVNESTAGGEANQLRIVGNSQTNNVTDRAYFGPINTSGLEQIKLQWRNYVYHYSSSYAYSVKIQTSTDGVNWTNTSWNHSPVTATQSASIQTVDINNADVGSSTLYIAFVVEGRTFGMHNWNIDDIKLTGLISPEIIWSPIDNLYVDENATQPYLEGVSSPKVYFKSNETQVDLEYNFVATNPNGCSINSSTLVSVIEVLEPIVTEQHFCDETQVEDIIVTVQQEGSITKWYSSETSIEALQTISTTGTYYVQQEIAHCKSERVEVTIYIDKISESPVADEVQIICDSGFVSDLKATPLEGNTIKWFSSIDDETPLDSNEALEPGIYYVSQFNEYCESPRLAVEVQINPTPSAPNNIDQEFCGLHPLSEINLNQAENATLNFYSSLTSENKLPLTTIIVTGTYYVSQTIAGCESERIALDVVALEALLAPQATANQLYCGSVTFANLEVTGDPAGEIGWFSSLNSQSPINENENVVTGTYYVSQYNGICWSPMTQVNVVVNPIPNAPSATDKEFCGEHTFADINFNQASNATLNWYSSLTSQTPLSLNAVVVTGTYYVSQTIGGCESSRVSTHILAVDYLPAPAAEPTQFYCGTITFNGLQAIANTGGIIGWFTTESSINPVLMTQVVTTGTYYVAQYNGVCWSPKTAVQVTSNPIPNVPNNTAQFLCGTYNFGQVSLGEANNATLKWYVSQNATSTIPMATVVQTGTYYVSQTIGGCESARIAIQLTATETLTTPIAATQTFCGSGTVGDLVAQGVQGVTFKWYSSSTSLIPLAPETPLSTGTYYVEQTKNSCSSPRRAVAVRVVSVTAPQVSPFVICGAGTIADLHIVAASGVTFKWFNSPSSTTELTQSTALATGTYFVERVQYGCVSARTAVQVTIASIPDAPTGASTQTFMEGSTIGNLILNQSGVVWYVTYNDSQNGINPLSSNMPLVNGTTYYAVIIGTNGCPSLPFAVTVDVVLSNKEFEKDKLKYYPNPVIDILNLAYSERITQIEVFDLLGKRVKVKNTDATDVEIDLSDLSSGTYMIQLKTETKSQFIKVVKQ